MIKSWISGCLINLPVLSHISLPRIGLSQYMLVCITVASNLTHLAYSKMCYKGWNGRFLIKRFLSILMPMNPWTMVWFQPARIKIIKPVIDKDHCLNVKKISTKLWNILTKFLFKYSLYTFQAAMKIPEQDLTFWLARIPAFSWLILAPSSINMLQTAIPKLQQSIYNIAWSPVPESKTPTCTLQ